MTDLVLDPVEVATSRTELALNAGSIRVGKDGIDWGDAQLEMYMAEAQHRSRRHRERHARHRRRPALR